MSEDHPPYLTDPLAQVDRLERVLARERRYAEKATRQLHRAMARDLAAAEQRADRAERRVARLRRRVAELESGGETSSGIRPAGGAAHRLAGAVRRLRRR